MNDNGDPASDHMSQHRQNDWGSVRYNSRFDEYSVPAGDASQLLFFCPWCGVRLPSSQRDRWFDELEKRGIDPEKGPIPAEFRTGAWRGAITEPRNDPER